jgi:hypothetical protein
MVCEGFTDSVGQSAGSVNPGITGTVDLSEAPPDLDEIISPQRRVIWPCADGVPVGAYLILSEPAFGGNSNAAQVVGKRVDWLLTRRTINDTLTFGSPTATVDQLDIARDLWRYAFGVPTVTAYSPLWGGGPPVKPAAQVPWLTLGDQLSGVMRYRLDNTDGYQADGKPVADALKALMELQNGHDYRLDYYRNDDRSLGARVTFGTPNVGSAPDAPGLVLEAGPRGGNLLNWSVALDGEPSATSVTYRGGQSPSLIVAAATAVDLHAQGLPLLEVALQDSSVTELGTLQEKANARLAGGRGPVVTITGDLDFPLTSYSLGDHVVLRISHRRWPRGPQNFVRRVVAWTVRPGRGGARTVVTPVFSAPVT